MVQVANLGIIRVIHNYQVCVGCLDHWCVLVHVSILKLLTFIRDCQCVLIITLLLQTLFYSFPFQSACVESTAMFSTNKGKSFF